MNRATALLLTAAAATLLVIVSQGPAPGPGTPSCTRRVRVARRTSERPIRVEVRASRPAAAVPAPRGKHAPRPAPRRPPSPRPPRSSHRVERLRRSPQLVHALAMNVLSGELPIERWGPTLRALGRAGTPRAQRELAGLLLARPGDGPLVRAALQGVAQVMRPEDALEQAVRQVARRAGNPRLLQAALLRLAGIAQRVRTSEPPRFDALRRLLHEHLTARRVTTRHAAVEAVAKLGDPAARQALQRASRDRDPGVRAAARRALSQFRDAH